MSPAAAKRWTLDGARSVFPDLRQRTERAARAVEELIGDRGERALEEDSTLRERVEQVVGSWVRDTEALGVDVKGLWLVDFDNGNGYYCWKWPEPELAHFHGYEEGFAGRTRIQ